MNYKNLKGVIEILKSNKKGNLAELLNDSYYKINESNSYGTYMHSVLSTFEIYSPIKKHVLLLELSENEKKDILKAVLKIFPPRANKPEITNLDFLYDSALDKNSKVENNFNKEGLKKFWNAFKSLIDEILNLGGFEYFVREVNTNFEGVEYIDINKYLLEETLIQKIGVKIKYPFSNSVPNNDTLISLIEFFFKYSKYLDGETAKPKLHYTININDIFTRFNLPLKLRKGKVYFLNSNLLDDVPDFFGFKILKNDQILFNLIKDSLRYYKEPIHQNLDTALEKIANALERAKTLLIPGEGNKKRSVKETIKLFSNKKKIQDIMETHIVNLTSVSNNFKIRHKETGQTELDSIEIKKFLFYEYYNILRFIIVTLENNLK